MKHKWLSYALIGIFLALCLTLSIGMLIVGPSQPGSHEQLSEIPLWKNEDGTWNKDYLSQWIDYVGDRFFLRQELISFDRWLTSHVFFTSGENGVILGKNDWLFYADTLNDYTGTAPLTDRELFSIVKNLELMKEYCEANGKEFLFVIAPNKNALYGQYMPHFGVTVQQTDAARLIAQLKQQGVPTVDLFAAFGAVDEPLYFAHDSHWNSKGAALGADLINQAFGVETSYFSDGFAQSERHDGDLYAMLYPALTDPETNPIYGGSLNFSFTSAATKPDAITLNTAGSGEGKLLAYRDSFGNLLFPYLADSYATARFSRSTTYDLTGDADFVLIEIVQRNLRYLLANLPVMPSPQREISTEFTASGSLQVTIGKRGSFTQIRGTLPQVDSDSPIYVLSGGIAYEAFCLKDGGFGANLPEGAAPDAVLFTSNGQPVLYQIEN